MKITLLYNPKAGDNSMPLEKLLKGLKKRGAEVKIQNSKEDDYAKVLEESCDFIIIAGGDGTIEKIAKLIVHKNIPIAILPFGSANNIASSLEVESTLKAIFQRWQNKDFGKFSVGSIDINGDYIYFFESVGWGLFAEVLSEIKSKKKKSKKLPLAQKNNKVDSGLKRLEQSIDQLQSSYYEIILDGMDFSGQYLWVEIMNTQSMGPQLQMAPEARHDDEFLDVVMVKEEEISNLKIFLNSQKGGGNNHSFKILKAKNIRVNSLEPIHIDDEIYQPDSLSKGWLDINLVPQSFWVINA